MMEVIQTHGEALSDFANLQTSTLMVMPSTDLPIALRAAQLMANRAGSDGHILVVEDKARWGFIRVINQAFLNSSSKYFGYVAQDAFPGRRWLSLALAALQPEARQFLGFNDGKWQGLLASFGLAKRAWASGNYEGNFFCPAYHSHYADTELTLLAMGDSAYVYDPNSVLIEVDWNKDTASANAEDRKTFEARKKTGFDQRIHHPQLLNLFS